MWVGCWGQAGFMGCGGLTNAEWDRLESFLLVVVRVVVGGVTTGG
jgi:hypothetical protein